MLWAATIHPHYMSIQQTHNQCNGHSHVHYILKGCLSSHWEMGLLFLGCHQIQMKVSQFANEAAHSISDSGVGWARKLNCDHLHWLTSLCDSALMNLIYPSSYLLGHFPKQQSPCWPQGLQQQSPRYFHSQTQLPHDPYQVAKVTWEHCGLLKIPVHYKVELHTHPHCLGLQ